MDLNTPSEPTKPNSSPKLLIYMRAHVDAQSQVISACPDWFLASLANKQESNTELQTAFLIYLSSRYLFIIKSFTVYFK